MNIKFTYDLTDITIITNMLSHLGENYIFNSIPLNDFRKIKSSLEEEMINSKSFTKLSYTKYIGFLELEFRTEFSETNFRIYYIYLYDIGDDYYIISVYFKSTKDKYNYITIKIDSLDDTIELLKFIINNFESSSDDFLGNFLINNLETNGY